MGREIEAVAPPRLEVPMLEVGLIGRSQPANAPRLGDNGGPVAEENGWDNEEITRTG